MGEGGGMGGGGGGVVFFFQAEDGIRDTSVTGVQTCALPILLWVVPLEIRVMRVQLKSDDMDGQVICFIRKLCAKRTRSASAGL